MKKNLLILIKLIKDGSDSGFLVKNGLSFSQISHLFSIAIENKFIKRVDNNFIVTDEGMLYLEKSDLGIASKNWILPDESFFTTKIPLDGIYLPKPRDVSFL
jgi:hypothetical protein